MQRGWCGLLIWAACSALLGPTTASLAQERYAVLVGVGQYPHLNERLQLKGPPNDVRLARDHLLHVEGFEDDHVIWLSDDAADPPTRANILTALDHLDELLQRDDFVFLHFAGHGSRQPARAGAEDEPDGYDELFLPRDTKGWSKEIGSVENAIIDDEIAGIIDSYRRKGADVWLVFDSCHSGTMTRGVGDDWVKERKVPKEALGVPEPAAAKPGSGSGATTQTPDLLDDLPRSERGMLIAFFAAHAAEETPEMPLPKRSKPKADARGLFSYSIFSMLGRFPGITYRQLAQLVTDHYASIPWRRNTPQFYGTEMDAVVFNGSGEQPALFRAFMRESDRTRVTVDAGTLRGLDIDATVSIYTSPLGDDEQLIGRGVVAQASLSEAEIEAEWRDDAKLPASHRIPVYVELSQPAYSPRVLIALLETARRQDNELLYEIVNDMKPRLPLVELASYDPDADYFAAVFDDRFWLLRPGQTLPCSARRITDEERVRCERIRRREQILWSDLDAAADLVTQAARTRSLTKLQAAVNPPSDLSIEIEVQRPTQAALTPLSTHQGPLHAGDKVYYSIRNRTNAKWDVFLFYVDSQLGIHALTQRGRSVRISADEALDKRLVGTITNDTKGEESLVVIAEPARDGLEADYHFLTQESYQHVTTRGADALRTQLQATLEAVWAGSNPFRRMRGMRSKLDGDTQTLVKVFTWTVE